MQQQIYSLIYKIMLKHQEKEINQLYMSVHITKHQEKEISRLYMSVHITHF